MPRKAKSEPEWESENERVYQAMRLNGMTALAGQVMWNEMQRDKRRLQQWWKKGKNHGDKCQPL